LSMLNRQFFAELAATFPKLSSVPKTLPAEPTASAAAIAAKPVPVEISRTSLPNCTFANSTNRLAACL
jgi:hypothetical protein